MVDWSTFFSGLVGTLAGTVAGGLIAYFTATRGEERRSRRHSQEQTIERAEILLLELQNLANQKYAHSRLSQTLPDKVPVFDVETLERELRIPAVRTELIACSERLNRADLNEAVTAAADKMYARAINLDEWDSTTTPTMQVLGHALLVLSGAIRDRRY